MPMRRSSLVVELSSSEGAPGVVFWKGCARGRAIFTIRYLQGSGRYKMYSDFEVYGVERGEAEGLADVLVHRRVIVAEDLKEL
jgi:hypothetical protein